MTTSDDQTPGSARRIQRFSSGGKREPVIGYCRTVKAGSLVFVSGCVAYGPDGRLVGEKNMYLQAKQCIINVERGLLLAGAKLEHVVRTRIFVTRISEWEAVARAHREAFGNHPPASTFLEVSALINPDMLVEIEADAVLS